MNRALIVTADEDARRVIGRALAGAEIVAAADLREAEALSSARPFDVAFVDTGMLQPLVGGEGSGSSVAAFHGIVPGARLVVLTPSASVREAVSFVRDGAVDYLTFPVAPEEVAYVLDSVERRERLRSELRYHRERTVGTDMLGGVSSRSATMRAALHKIRQVAPTRSTVLLTGETGTGKSFLARVIHQHSNRADRQFISVHCGAIPDTLLESELFGHERGAFTGADRRRLGKFEIASGGTIFLDEVATVSPAMQVKLLDVLQERRVQRVGAEHPVEVDVRILAATNVDLGSLTARGEFRSDLFYRLNVFPIEVPPLRARREDIPLLVDALIDKLNRTNQKTILGVHPKVMGAFESYSWPGNVRELENLLERAFILENGTELSPGCFPEEILGNAGDAERVDIGAADTLAEARSRAVAEVERRYLERVLLAHSGRIDATARAAGITPRQLHTLMSRYGLKKEHYRGEAND